MPFTYPYYVNATNTELERAVCARDFDAVIELTRRFTVDGYAKSIPDDRLAFEDTAPEELVKARIAITALEQKVTELLGRNKKLKARLDKLTEDDEL